MNLVSIILFAELVDKKIVDYQLNNLINQFYKNKEIFVLYSKKRDDLEDLILKHSFNNCSFIAYENTINEGIKYIQSLLNGDIVFYKTCNPVDWMPRHIDVHVENYKRNKNINWYQSLIEIRDMAQPNQHLGTIDWRLNNFKPEEFELDEISHKKDLKIDWDKPFEKNNFDKKQILLQLKNGGILDEISIIKYINTAVQQKNQIALQLGEPDKSEIEFKENYFPTILGNIVQTPRNKKILQDIEQVNPDDIKTIAIKRTAGMGDVMMTEPIKRFLKNKYKNAKITLLTNIERGDITKYLGYDEVITLDESYIIKDALSQVIKTEEVVEDLENGEFTVKEIEKYNRDNYQIKVDLDLSYESRYKPYVDCYFEQIDVNPNELELSQKLYELDFDKKYDESKTSIDFYIHRDGSGWAGKTFPDEKWNNVKTRLEKENFTFTEGRKFDTIDQLIDELLKHKFYLGTDSGVMHIALALGLKCIVIAGAALPEYTAKYYLETGQLTSIHAAPEELSCVGCKHKMFFELLNNGGLTFVAPCRNQNGPLCMTAVNEDDIFDSIIKAINFNQVS